MPKDLPRVIAKAPPVDGSLLLDGEESHHLLNVKRFQENDQVEVFVKDTNSFYLTEIQNKSLDSISLKIIEELALRPLPKIHLAVGYPKSKTAEFIIEKCVELGVQTLSFFEASRSQSLFDTKRLARVERIRDSAFKQSKSSVYSQLQFNLSWNDVLATKAENKIILSPKETKSLLFTNKLAQNKPCDFSSLDVSMADSKTSLENLTDYADSLVVIGPEGGLTNNEVEEALASGFSVLGLGPNILRVETACILASGFLIQRA